MPEFKDAAGTAWDVSIDGLVLAELRDKAQVDLAQDGLYYVEEREDLLLKVLLILCREQLTERTVTDKQFARLIVGEVTDRAIEAVRGAATVFFRPSKWSAILSRCDQRRQIDQQWQGLKPLFDTLNKPDISPEFRQSVMAALGEKIREGIGSATSGPETSASGPDASLPNAAGVSPGSSDSIPKE